MPETHKGPAPTSALKTRPGVTKALRKMRPEETSAWMKPGQFWARLSPLYLMEILSAQDQENSGTIEALYWTPEVESDTALFITPMAPESYRFLWWAGTFPRDFFSRLSHNAEKASVGDVFLAESPRDGERPRLLFIGPETTDDAISVKADWHVRLYQQGPHFTLYQEGPRRKPLAGKTAWQHVKENV